MVLARLRTGDWIAGAWGLVLLASTFLAWYDLGGATINAWEAFGVIDVFLALLLVLVAALVIATARAASPAVPIALDVIACAFAAIVLALVLYRHVNEPGPNSLVAVDAGAYIGLLAVLGVFAGTALAMRDERMPAVPPGPVAEVLPAPPAS
jgi:hypothetical protein